MNFLLVLRHPIINNMTVDQLALRLYVKLTINLLSVIVLSVNVNDRRPTIGKGRPGNDNDELALLGSHKRYKICILQLKTHSKKCGKNVL